MCVVSGHLNDPGLVCRRAAAYLLLCAALPVVAGELAGWAEDALVLDRVVLDALDLWNQGGPRGKLNHR